MCHKDSPKTWQKEILFIKRNSNKLLIVPPLFESSFRFHWLLFTSISAYFVVFTFTQSAIKEQTCSKVSLPSKTKVRTMLFTLLPNKLLTSTPCMERHNWFRLKTNTHACIIIDIFYGNALNSSAALDGGRAISIYLCKSDNHLREKKL